MTVPNAPGRRVDGVAGIRVGGRSGTGRRRRGSGAWYQFVKLRQMSSSSVAQEAPVPMREHIAQAGSRVGHVGMHVAPGWVVDVGIDSPVEDLVEAR